MKNIRSVDIPVVNRTYTIIQDDHPWLVYDGIGGQGNHRCEWEGRGRGNVRAIQQRIVQSIIELGGARLDVFHNFPKLFGEFCNIQPFDPL